ncbi:MAG: T9SS type A sorting domain-containing protein [Flavobacteriales bacterium]
MTDVSCNGGNDGEIDITFSGGTAPLTFLWTNTGGFSSTDQNLTGLAAGDYDGVATDANGCTSSGTVTVNEPTAITATSVVEDVNCNGDSDGEIDLTVAGGTPNYTFSWTDGGAFSSTDEDLTGLSAGIYEVTITDDNNCVATLSVTVNEPTALAASATSTDETLGNDGSIDLTVMGGTAPYSFSWTDGGAFSSTDEDLSGLSAGTYEVTITDDNGCTTTLQVIVGTIVGITEINLIEFNLFPNPANDLYTISVSTSGTLEVYGNNGQLVSTESIESGKTTKDVHQLATGVYTIRFVTENGVAVKRLVVNK